MQGCTQQQAGPLSGNLQQPLSVYLFSLKNWENNSLLSLYKGRPTIWRQGATMWSEEDMQQQAAPPEPRHTQSASKSYPVKHCQGTSKVHMDATNISSHPQSEYLFSLPNLGGKTGLFTHILDWADRAKYPTFPL